MVYRLRNKFIRIMMLSFVAVLAALFLILYAVTSYQTNSSLDVFADLISQNGGFFPRPNDKGANFDALPFAPERMNPEAPYTTRFFSVQFDRNDVFAFVDVTSIGSISRDKAIDYAEKALVKKQARGWMGDYRYKIYETEFGRAVVFVNGADTKSANRMFMFSTAAVFAGSCIVLLLLVIILSKRAVKPTAESYEKQKQFITDANHELKTPLTIIRADLELAESELGKNEWLDDIREASEDMTELVGKLVAMARMDEEGTKAQMLSFSLSEAVADTAQAFTALSEHNGLTLQLDIAPEVSYTGDEAMLRQLVSILLDNAEKYCDSGGSIAVTLRGGRHPLLTVDNTFHAVDDLELHRLFDRFYRADKARTRGSGSGIGLSIAQSIVEKHRGKIEAQKFGDATIRFRVRL